ncbi:MAG: radical SAM protein [Candidatus Omnitrophota bacterium]|jgi:pyrroloquinoline quinone biosynthesis protein E
MNTIAMIRDILEIVWSNHTIPQKYNYIKYLFSGRRECLEYAPVTISIVATNRCTLACDMCPTHSSRVPRDYPNRQNNIKDIDFIMFKEIVDRFSSAVTLHIIGSGEPLLNKDLFKMVDYAASRRMVVKTFSNGTVIEKNIDNILNSELDGITISINGHNPEEFARMTGMDGGIYNQIYDATKHLVEERDRRRSRVNIKLSFIVDKLNYKFIPEMVGVGLKLGVDRIFFCNFLPSPYDGLRAEERVLMYDPDLSAEIEGMLKKYPVSVRKKITPPILVDAQSKQIRCSTYFSQIRIDGDGNVSSCSMMLLNMEGHGSFRDADVWNNEFFKSMRRKFLSKDSSLLPEPCMVCTDNKGR